MKKLTAAVLVLSLLFLLGSCSHAEKLNGNFVDCNGDRRYNFFFTENNSGEYGGTCDYYEKGQLKRSDAWYAEDDKIYVNGVLTFYYDGEYLVELSSKCGEVSVNGKVVTGTVPGTVISGLSFKTVFFYNPDITFKDDGTCEATGQLLVLAKKTIPGTYEVDGKLVKMTFEDEDCNHTAVVYNKEMYFNMFKKS